MKRLKNLIDKIKKIIHDEYFLMECLFFIGLIIISTTNFCINLYFGLYFIGAILIAYSIFLFKFRKKRGDKR